MSGRDSTSAPTCTATPKSCFYVLDAQLDLLAFEPRVRTSGNWQSWESHTGVILGRP